MTSISQCPECQEWVSLPSVVDRNARAQCPLCDAQYTVGDVVKNAPPELILLDASPQTGPSLTGTEVSDHLDIQLASSALGQADSLEAPVLNTGGPDDGSASLATARRPTSSASPMRFIRNVVLGGLAGLALGYFILLWIAGPSADFLDLGSKLPKILLPSSFDE